MSRDRGFSLSEAKEAIYASVRSDVPLKKIVGEEYLKYIRGQLFENCCAALLMVTESPMPSVYSADRLSGPLDDDSVIRIISDDGRLIDLIDDPESIRYLVNRVRSLAFCSFAGIPVFKKDDTVEPVPEKDSIINGFADESLRIFCTEKLCVYLDSFELTIDQRDTVLSHFSGLFNQFKFAMRDELNPDLKMYQSLLTDLLGHVERYGLDKNVILEMLEEVKALVPREA